MAHILLIDDDRLVREATNVLLRVNGHRATLAADGKSGIEAMGSTKFDLAIVDLFMPGLDGLKVIEAIRQLRPDMPIIVASGFMFKGECPPMPNFEPMAKEAGAVATLYKPFRPDVFLQTIAEALENGPAA
ncbi:MAG TPA: response regulator [Stellaceae bacterium]|jgi:CheY-like chemotaxis protein|nr:response regulator [Stellaceae bacterium]